ncbi:hypothetical protein [Mangrovibacillus cuniculi]|uniref:Uncharacterized protein n=1 Tax=Mangrovibacillus cuniculi TaxID=2593652 RepID=A0A7S8C9V7_9BACI|nr:hypothetical protein [Mangrovibacillus cuniculi]QPC45868.1 hypothetical protein G8O30_02290 [Mangrovibacillus cuniculi]
MDFFILLFFFFTVAGLYLFVLGLWEFRVATDKKKFVTYTTTGLFLMVVFRWLMFNFHFAS